MMVTTEELVQRITANLEYLGETLQDFYLHEEDYSDGVSLSDLKLRRNIEQDLWLLFGDVGSYLAPEDM